LVTSVRRLSTTSRTPPAARRAMGSPGCIWGDLSS
jgi:hypothetical protein